MVTFDIIGDGPLGPQRVTPGNVEKHRADFRWLLDRGVVLANVTATVTSLLSTVSGAAMSNDRKSAVWFINTTAAGEQFVLNLTVTTNDGQTLAYAISYVVG